jgi:hypothetical protein
VYDLNIMLRLVRERPVRETVEQKETKC